MPYQPAWFHRPDEILETLRAMEASHLDRQAVQKLFSVRKRRARQLMAGFAGPSRRERFSGAPAGFNRPARRDGVWRGVSVGDEIAVPAWSKSSTARAA